MRQHSTTLRAAGTSRRARRGLTLTELLAATAILAFALVGMATTWLYMTRLAANADVDAGAYQCARMVLERARANGFNGYEEDVSRPTQTLSVPATDIDENLPTASFWSAPNIARHRFYNDRIEEVGTPTDAQAWPEAPQGARYAVRTEFQYTPVDYPDGVVAARPDLRLLTLTVSLYLVNGAGEIADPNGPPVVFLSTVLTQGGF